MARQEPNETDITQIEAMAIRQRWPISDEQKAAIAARQVRIATKSRIDRNATSAARVLISMESQNIEDEQSANSGGAEIEQVKLMDLLVEMNTTIPRKPNAD